MTHDRHRLWWAVAFLTASSILALIGLAGGSGWLVATVIATGAVPALFLLPGAMAFARTLARYLERMVGHRAAISDQTERRAALFKTFARAPGTRTASWQLDKPGRLSDFLEDINAVDYAPLRCTLPIATVFGAGLLLAVATAILAPLALLALFAFLVAGWAWRGWRTSLQGSVTQQRALVRRGTDRLGVALRSAVPLSGEGRFKNEISQALADVAAVDRLRRADDRRQANAEAALGLLCPTVAAGVVVSAAIADSQTIAGAALGLAFAWLAIGELVVPLARADRAGVQAETAKKAITLEIDVPAVPVAPNTKADFHALFVSRVTTRAPDGRALTREVSFTASRRGQVAITGSSGVGKTCFLKVLAGWMPAGGGCIRVDGSKVDDAQLRVLCHLCLHDAAILSDTVRANLFAADVTDAEIRTALACVEMDGVVYAKGGLDAWIGQTCLSAGEAQRLNLARALLSRQPIVLLDEPWEHLEEAQVSRIARNVLTALEGRIVIFSTHKHTAHDATGISLVSASDPASQQAGGFSQWSTLARQNSSPS